MKTDEFLPNGYKVPVSPSNYMKFGDGENTFRVLTSAIVGYQYWNVDGKPVRVKDYPETMPSDIRAEKDGNKKIKPFWAFVVWNYQTKQIQILELTQKSIMTDIKALVDNHKWGNPKNYDITITKDGEGLDTEYATMPNPHSDIEDSVKNAFVDKKINLEA
jgi:hypothetical protein